MGDDEPPRLPELKDPMARITIGPFSYWITDRLIRYRWWLLGIAVLLAPTAFFYSQKLDFNRSIESMFAGHDPVLPPYQRLKERFGGNEIILAVYEDTQLLAADGSGLRRLLEVTKEIKEVYGIQGVLCLSDINDALARLYSISKLKPWELLSGADQIFQSSGNGETDNFPIVDPNDENAVEFLNLFEGYTHGSDGKTVSIACILEPKDKVDVPRWQIVKDLRVIIDRLPEGQLTGEPVMVADGFKYVQRDGERLGLNCVILLSFVIIICFRSIRWVLIPLAVMQLTLWLTRGLLHVGGIQLSMVSSMLTAIVTVIAVATSMHVILRYREARTAGKNQVESMRSAIALLFWPIFWSCLTDAVGFASLLIASVGPIQDFGIMMALASILVLFCILLLVVPLGLLGKLDADPKQAWGESRMRKVLSKSAEFISLYPGKLAIVISLFAMVLATGNFFLQVETDFTKNFRADTPIAVSYNFVEKRLGGAGVIDVVLPAPNQLDAKYLERVREFEAKLRALEFEDDLEAEQGSRGKALTKVISLADLDQASSNITGVNLIPLSIRLAGMKQMMPNMYASLYSRKPDENGKHYYRVMLRTSQRHTSEQKRWLMSEIQSLAEADFEPEAKQHAAETTGFYVLLSRLVNSILRDQYWTFGIAIVGIALVMMIAFRNLTLALIALVPNLLPILVVMGTLGWLGIKINMGAAMIAAVSLGLSIDSSIQYLWSFQRWRDAGLSLNDAIIEAQLRVGRAVVFSTIALVLGFSSLCISEFVPTIYFGALVGATMLGGLIGNLVVLPTLLHLVYGRRSE